MRCIGRWNLCYTLRQLFNNLYSLWKVSHNIIIGDWGGGGGASIGGGPISHSLDGKGDAMLA